VPRACRSPGSTADEESAGNPGLCDYLQESRIPYVMVVPKNTQFIDTGGTDGPVRRARRAVTPECVATPCLWDRIERVPCL